MKELQDLLQSIQDADACLLGLDHKRETADPIYHARCHLSDAALAVTRMINRERRALTKKKVG